MEHIDINDLHGNVKNPRRISKHDYDKLVQSIKKFGDLSGIVRNVTTNQLVGGHQRIQAFKELGGQPTIVERLAEPNSVGTTALGYVLLGDEKYGYREVQWGADFEKAANVAANRIQGEFDLDLLAELNYELSQLDNGADLLALTGQTEDEISKLLDQVSGDEHTPEEDEAPEVDNVNPPVSQPGEIYQLGRHRLMCGSSTDMGQVSDLVNGTTIDMVFTDPPYNAAFNGRSGNHEVIMNDKLPNAEFTEFINEFIQTMYMVVPDGPKYICTDWKMYPLIYGAMANPNACIVWVKNMFGMGNGYRHQHELIVFEGKLEANDQSDVWEIKRDNGADYDHPTQKPVAIPERAILNSTKRGGSVLDLFGGSGPTIIAAEKHDRHAFVMELDPKYCDVIRKRYAKHIGQEEQWQTATPVIQTAEAETEPATV